MKSFLMKIANLRWYNRIIMFVRLEFFYTGMVGSYTYNCSSWLSSISITFGCDIEDLLVVKLELFVSLSSPKLVILESFLFFIVSWLSSVAVLRFLLVLVVMRLLEWVVDVGGIILLSPLSTFFIPASNTFLHFSSVRFGL